MRSSRSVVSTAGRFLSLSLCIFEYQDDKIRRSYPQHNYCQVNDSSPIIYALEANYNFMSKYELIRSLRSEIKKLNRVIDHKIILGLPYGDDSRRHKFLTLQLKRLTPPAIGFGFARSWRIARFWRIGWFSRSMGFVSMFMF